MRPRPPRSTRKDTLFPFSPLFRSTQIYLTDEQRRRLDARGRRMGAPLARMIREAVDSYLADDRPNVRSEEHTSELQSLMRISYDVFCLKKKNKTQITY